MRIFITGASGFIGKPTVRELRKRKHIVHAMRSRMQSPRAVEDEMRKAKPDAVIHLAWEGIPDLGPATSAKNRKNSIALLRIAARLRVPKVIVTGSCYQRKGTDPGNHRAFIAAKNAIQKAGARLIGCYGTFIWTYPYFVYGPGKRSGSLIPSLIREARAGKAPVAQNPDAWHDFVYVDDVARALALLAEKPAKGGGYDIGSGVLVRTGEIANTIAHAFGFPRQRLAKKKVSGRKAQIGPLTKNTGWKPATFIAAGIKKTIPSI